MLPSFLLDEQRSNLRTTADFPVDALNTSDVSTTVATSESGFLHGASASPTGPSFRSNSSQGVRKSLGISSSSVGPPGADNSSGHQDRC